MSDQWSVADKQIKKLRESPVLRAIASDASELPAAARLSDDLIIHFASSTTYTLGIHNAGAQRLYGVQIYSGMYSNVITGDPAKIMWIGLCMIAADWRKLAEPLEEPSRAGTKVPQGSNLTKACR